MSAHWAEILKAVVLEVLGQPAERRGNEWRYGRHGSLVVNIGGQRAGTWRDFEAGHGGGTLELLRHYQDLDKPQALEWLRARGLLPNSRPESRPTVITCIRDQPRAKNAGKRAPAPQERASGPDPDLLRRIDRARSWWQASQSIPTSTEHPAPVCWPTAGCGGRSSRPSPRCSCARRRPRTTGPGPARGGRRAGEARHGDAPGRGCSPGQPPPAGGLSSDPRCRGPGRRRAKRKENWRRLRSSTYASNRSNSALGGKRQKGTARV